MANGPANDPKESGKPAIPGCEDERMREILYHVARAIQGLEYGTVQITVHDAQVTQIERIEKVRFPLQPGGKGGSKNAAKSRVFP